MDKIINQIKKQQEINFINIEEQINKADLSAVLDGVNNSRYIFHNLHSMDSFFINPIGFVYEGEKLFGIPENLSVISTSRAGFEPDTSIVISRQQLLDYFDYVRAKINSYFDTLKPEDLTDTPEGCEYSRLELILAQFRHMMWHVGLSSGITFQASCEWNEFTGLNGLRRMIESGK